MEGFRPPHWLLLDAFNLFHTAAENAKRQPLSVQNPTLYVLLAPCDIDSSQLLFKALTEMISWKEI